jgi:hypothetical protein
MTTREITGPLALLDDAFVRYRVPRISLTEWISNSKVPEKYKTEEAWNKLEGRIERASTISTFFADPSIQTFHWPRRIQDYYDEMVLQMLRGSRRKCEPNINVVEWIRARVYEALSFCQTGPEIIDQCASAITRNCNEMEPDTFWNVMKVLSESEPHTSYRTPLSLEWAFFNMFEEMRKTNKNRSRDERTLADNETDSATTEVMAAEGAAAGAAAGAGAAGAAGAAAEGAAACAAGAAAGAACAAAAGAAAGAACAAAAGKAGKGKGAAPAAKTSPRKRTAVNKKSGVQQLLG